ncbi:MAG: hypothetical protein IKK53_03050 [Ruminiclostridium sp.]|nr:hypothetical protein [Ruminiclostridium sp.]
MKILKILAILAVSALSLFAAVYFTELYVAEVNAKEKTLAQVIIQNQLEAEMNKAEEQAKEELGEALITTVLETKPVTTTTTPATTTVTTTTTTTTTLITTTTTGTTTLPPEEEIITEFTRGGILPEDRWGIPIKTIFTLTEGEQLRFTNYLVEHYFLNGDIYVENETRPALREKKAVANEMEKSAIAALNLVMESINLSDITSIMTADYGYIGGEIKTIRDSFKEKYKNAAEYGEQYKKLYDESLLFLDRLIVAVEKLEKSSREYSQSTNAFLAGIVLARTVEEVIIPEIMAVLEQSFGLVEITQEIFLEGTQGTKLLSREEVSDIITNPALVLDTGLA